MTGTPVTIQDILEARDARAQRQAELIKKYALPVVSLTMNIAGEIKRYPMADLAFYDCIDRIKSELGEPAEIIITDENTGLEALLCYYVDSFMLKELCVSIEESTEIGRLYDLDVISPGGNKLTRGEPRKCIVCGGPVSICSRSRAHGLDSIKACTQSILRRYAAGRLSEEAVASLIEEAELTPKPGLVDARDSGSHKDMNLALLIKSAESLAGYFRSCAELGFSCFDNAGRLKAEGVKAESIMLTATNGVNTHKGAVYLLGLLTAAAAYGAVSGADPYETASRLAAMLDNSEPGSHGDILRKKYRDMGPKAESLAGFPLIRFAAGCLRGGDSKLRTLIKIINRCDDTNLIHRGGIEGLEMAESMAATAMKIADEGEFINYVNLMNNEFIRRNLSPGGAADILSSALFMNRTGRLFHHDFSRSRPCGL